MKFVSAEWVDSVGGGKTIKAIGDDGQEYWVGGLDSDVPPWPEFLAEKGVEAISGDAPPPLEPAIEEETDAGA